MPIRTNTIIQKLGKINHILAMYPLRNPPGLTSMKYLEVINLQKDIIKELMESTNK